MSVSKALTVGLLLAPLLLGCRKEPPVMVAAPDFELKDLSGKKLSLASLRGKPVLLDFWATWCGPCRLSIPTVQQFYEKHKEKGFVVVGVNVDEDPSPVYSFVKQFGMTYPVVYGGGTPISDTYQVEGIPTFVFIDIQGRITKRYSGFRPDIASDWEDELQRITATH